MARILACIDFSDVTDRVLDAAARLSRALGAELVVLHVAAPDPAFVGYDPGPQSVRDNVAEELREQHRELGTRVSALVAGGVNARALMVQGATAERISEHAERLGAEFVVLGSHGHGKLHHLLVGSVADAVLRRARVPVLTVPARH
jgi:nucleotide-binding universal stress UspA family protein